VSLGQLDLHPADVGGTQGSLVMGMVVLIVMIPVMSMVMIMIVIVVVVVIVIVIVIIVIVIVLDAGGWGRAVRLVGRAVSVRVRP
jgi:hypothetical protein